MQKDIDEMSIEELKQLLASKKEKEKKDLRKEKAKVSWYSKFIVFLVIALNFWFANRVLDSYFTLGQEPVVLTGAWFAFTTGELWLLSKITRQGQELDAQVLEAENECENEEEENYYYEQTDSNR